MVCYLVVENICVGVIEIVNIIGEDTIDQCFRVMGFTSGSIEKGEEGIVDERVNKITAASSGGIVKEVDVKVTH